MGELYSIKRDKNYLAHYGVKGMKWKNHQYATPEESPGVESSFTVDKNGTSYTTFKAAEAARQVGIEKQRQDEIAKRKAAAKRNTPMSDVRKSIKKWWNKPNNVMHGLASAFGFTNDHREGKIAKDKKGQKYVKWKWVKDNDVRSTLHPDHYKKR